MRLAKLRLKNFRCYNEEEVSIDFDNFTAIIGKNDIGKSTIFKALEIFFDDLCPDKDDGCIYGNKNEIRIICEFDNLPNDIIIDSTHSTTLKDEYLLNSNETLEIHKIYNGTLQTPKVSHILIHTLHPSVDKADDLIQLKNTELKSRAKELGIDISTINSTINSEIRKKIWSSFKDLKITDTFISVNENEILKQISSNFPVFGLFSSDRESNNKDKEAQDPMKLAIKEALKTKEEELKKITESVQKEVQEIADKTVEKIKEMNPDLANQLNPKFTKPDWSKVFKINLTGDEEISINKRGSGVRRFILLNFFRAKTEKTISDKKAQSVIYAIEEPETCQHPDNQKLLLNSLQEISEHPNCQVMITTHNPLLARLINSKNLRFIYKNADDKRVISNQEDQFDQISKELGILFENDIKLFIGVEGSNDINFLKSISKVLTDSGENFIDLNKMEKENQVIFFPLGGSNLALWSSRLAKLNRPEFHIYDRDTKPSETPKYQINVDAINQRKGCKGVLTNKLEIENYLHPQAIKMARNVDVSFGDFDDVPEIVAKKIHEDSESTNLWVNLSAKDKKDKSDNAKKWLNKESSAAMTLELLKQSDPNGDIIGWFKDMENLINGGK